METVILDFTTNTSFLINFLLDNFIKGISESKYPVHRIKLSSIEVLDCKACTEDIWFDPNCACKCEDDFSVSYPILKKSQLLVFAFDLDYRNLLKELSKVIDRLEPLFQLNYNGDSLINAKKILSLVFSRANNSLAEKVSTLLEEFSSIYNYEFLGQIHRGQIHLMELMPESIVKSLGFDLDFYKLAFDLSNGNTLSENLQSRIQRDLTPDDSVLNKIFSAYRRF